jgi:hypothetical protein
VADLFVGFDFHWGIALGKMGEGPFLQNEPNLVMGNPNRVVGNGYVGDLLCMGLFLGNSV